MTREYAPARVAILQRNVINFQRILPPWDCRNEGGNLRPAMAAPTTLQPSLQYVDTLPQMATVQLPHHLDRACLDQIHASNAAYPQAIASPRKLIDRIELVPNHAPNGT